MSIGSRTLQSDLPTLISPFVLLHRRMARAVATLALRRARARERQLALWRDPSLPGFIRDGSIFCTEAELEQWISSLLRSRRHTAPRSPR